MIAIGQEIQIPAFRIESHPGFCALVAEGQLAVAAVDGVVPQRLQAAGIGLTPTPGAGYPATTRQW